MARLLQVSASAEAARQSQAQLESELALISEALGKAEAQARSVASLGRSPPAGAVEDGVLLPLLLCVL